MTDGLDGYAKAPVELPQVRILRLEPDDILVFNIPHRITDTEFLELGERTKTVLPGHKILVLEDGMTLDVLRRERIEAGERP